MSEFSSPSKSACIAIHRPSGENSGLSIASFDFATARSRPVLRSLTYMMYCSPLFAEYARSRPSEDTSKFSSSQILRRNRRGMKVTFRCMVRTEAARTRWDIKAMPFEDVRTVMTIDVASLPITVGVGGFLVRGDRLLVVRKTYGPWAGLWTIPSGYVEPRESVSRTVEREVEEEAGVLGKTEALVGVRNLITDRVNDTFLVFSMSYVSGEA